MQNKSIFDFTKESHFLLDLREKNFKNLINNIVDLNVLKPTIEEIFILDNYINELNKNIINSKEDLNDNMILPEYHNALLSFIPRFNII